MWGEWGNWTTCSETCGGGNQTRIRLCDNPAVAHGGAACASNSSYTETTNGTGIAQQEAMQACNEHPCPSKQLEDINFIFVIITKEKRLKIIVKYYLSNS